MEPEYLRRFWQKNVIGENILSIKILVQRLQWPIFVLIFILSCADQKDEIKFKADQNWKKSASDISYLHSKNQLSFLDGESAFVFQSNDEIENAISSTFEFENIDITFDFMLSKGASYTVLIHGLYAIKVMQECEIDSLALLDSEELILFKKPTCSKAPGLWQHLEFSFLAPVYDSQNKQIQAAKLEQVKVNGDLIYSEKEIPPVLENGFIVNKTKGPFVIKGGKGDVAIKDIQYKKHGNQKLQISKINYSVSTKKFKTFLDDLDDLKSDYSNITDSISYLLSSKEDIIIFEGKMNAPTSGDYTFYLDCLGKSQIFIDNEIIIEKWRKKQNKTYVGDHYLVKGQHDFKIIFANKNDHLELSYEGPDIKRTYITTPASNRINRKEGELPIEINKPTMQRCFWSHKNSKITNAIAVGNPDGSNYVYDIDNKSIIGVWKGGYLDLGEMWLGRGESQIAKPLGLYIEMPSQSIFEEDSQKKIRSVGYQLNSEGYPTFKYFYDDIAVDDNIDISLSNELRRSVIFNSKKDKNIVLKLNKNSDFELDDNGAFAIDNRSYYIDNIKVQNEYLDLNQTNSGSPEISISLEKGLPKKLSYSIYW